VLALALGLVAAAVTGAAITLSLTWRGEVAPTPTRASPNGPVPVVVATLTATPTPSSTAADIPTQTFVATSTPTPSVTPSETATASLTATSTASPTGTVTLTRTPGDPAMSCQNIPRPGATQVPGEAVPTGRATTFTWTGKTTAEYISRETAREIAELRRTLPSPFRTATDLQLASTDAAAYTAYVKTYVGAPSHYYLREYVLWRTARQSCWGNPVPKPLPPTVTATDIQAANLTPNALDDASDVGSFGTWLANALAHR
jgi:hypothetical protein